MNIHKYILLTLVAVMLFGCTAPQVPSYEPVSLARTNKARAMAVAEDVLADMQFTIEKSDPDKGVITTRPLRGGQLFEFWRRDNASAAAQLESAVQSLQRTVRLDFTEADSQLTIACNVDVRRLSLPENDHVTRSRAAGMFTSSTTAIQTFAIPGQQAQNMEWIDLGPDPALQERILRLIQNRIAANGS